MEGEVLRVLEVLEQSRLVRRLFALFQLLVDEFHGDVLPRVPLDALLHH